MPLPSDTELSVRPDTRSSRERIEKLAWILDSAITLPGTRFRFGLDSIIGLIPGVGDLVGLVLGAAILYEGVRLGAPRPLILRMLGNSIADALLGVVPVLGDVLDFAFRSNRRNAKLLIEHLDRLDSVKPRCGSNALAFLLVAAFIAAAAGLIWFAWRRLLD